MSLRHKMSFQIACMIAGLLLTSAAGLWGINGLHEDYGSALSSSGQLRDVFEVASHLVTADELLRASPDNRRHAADQVDRAVHKLQLSFARLKPDSPAYERNLAYEDGLTRSLNAALFQLNRGPESATSDDLRRDDAKAIADALAQVRSFATQINQQTKDRQDAANQRRHRTIFAVEMLCGIVVAGAIWLGILQYRSVLGPLKRLTGGVRKIAAGQFTERLDEHCNEEFSSLANEFNRMAADLDEFYHRLEQKVADNTRELIRSERMAGVGYLAAGVAHEINNPLGIIAGYAEYSLSQIGREPDDPGTDVRKSLQIICDEAFRCKEIIGKLLSLARPGEVKRQAVDLGRIAGEVTSAVIGLRGFADRKLVVIAAEGVVINAVETEVKQIVLNLTVNALEAVAPGGEVRIEVTGSDDGWAELRVRDNGRGMSPQTLDRLFEPFFTDKRGTREPGTGLGLSITHAIIANLGGSIRASSRGAGRGSEFVVRLPPAVERSVT